MRRESPFPTQKRKANESHKQSIGQQPNRETVPNSEAYPKDADYLYLRPLEGARAPHCLVLEAGVGGYVTSLAKGVPFLSERFFNHSESAHFSAGGFFPFVNGDRPSISPEDGCEDTVFQSVLELFDGSYFGSWNFTSAEKILKARDVIIDKVAIHFQFSQVGTGFFQSSGVGIIILEGLLEIFPEIFVILCDWIAAS